MASIHNLPILEPLMFPTSHPEVSSGMNSREAAVCLFCEDTFCIPNHKTDLLQHLLLQHKFVIADIDLVTDIPRYLSYWKDQFQSGNLTDYCVIVLTNTLPTDQGPQELYYMLSDALPEDKQLRQQLQQERLEKALADLQLERSSEGFSRGCLFCRQHFSGNRDDFFNHLTFDHNFNVGLPDNIVYAEEFVDYLDGKMQRLQCFYCERTFKDRVVLKEHMRKKMHKKLNPRNKDYDKFYIINYLELGKNWETVKKEVDPVDALEDDDWSDWMEAGDGVGAVCLFCSHSSSEVISLYKHMKEAHNFDFCQLKEELGLSFYQQVKLVNFIRRQVFHKSCIFCSECCVDTKNLLSHMEENSHFKPPPIEVWNEPQYYFPTYENDNLLCALGDDEETVEKTGSSSEEVVVLPEDLPETVLSGSVLEEEQLRRSLQ